MKSFKNVDFVWEMRWLWLWLIRLLLDLITGVDGTVIYLLSRSLAGILKADIKINCFTRERNSVRRLELWCRRRKKRENCLSWGILSGEEREKFSPVRALLWLVFTNECRVTSREGLIWQGTTLSLVRPVRPTGTLIYSLSGNWMLETWNPLC